MEARPNNESYQNKRWSQDALQEMMEKEKKYKKKIKNGTENK